MAFDLSSVKRRIANYSVKEFEMLSRATQARIEDLSRASVLIPIYISSENEIVVLLTIRGEKLSHNPGEVCLPGGKREPEDVSDIDTALREASEELGINIEENIKEILGILPPSIARNELVIIPVVTLMKGPPPIHVAHSVEVSMVFLVSLKEFLKAENHSIREEKVQIIWSPGSSHQHINRIHYFDIRQNGPIPKIWGLTAHILIQTARCFYPSHAVEFEFEPQDGPSYSEIVEGFIGWKNSNAE